MKEMQDFSSLDSYIFFYRNKREEGWNINIAFHLQHMPTGSGAMPKKPSHGIHHHFPMGRFTLPWYRLRVIFIVIPAWFMISSFLYHFLFFKLPLRTSLEKLNRCAPAIVKKIPNVILDVVALSSSIRIRIDKGFSHKLASFSSSYHAFQKARGYI